MNIKSITLLVLLTGLTFAAFSQNKEQAFVNENLKFAEQQTQSMINSMGGNFAGKYPRSFNHKGELTTTDGNDWTDGFFPGTLWYLYELSGDTAWKNYAQEWTNPLESGKYNTSHHDIGFLMYCSFGNGYRLSPNEKYKAILIQSAESALKRFNPKVGSIQSWNYGKAWDGVTEWHFPVIIDNMMNLELLFWASKTTGDPRFRNIAITHANTTLKNHIRPDFSTYHVVDYDTATGAVKDRATCQGYSDNSTWARGQAWAIYGFTMTYRETQDPAYLNVAKKLADWYLHNPNLPADKIPYWDFNAGQDGYTPENKSKALTVTEKYRDASAAAIVCSALFELSELSKDKTYRKAAIEILHNLASPAYRAALGKNGNFLLMHCVGSIPHGGEVDVPIVYADYYFMEALQRYKKSMK